MDCEAAWTALESERAVDAALLERAGRHLEHCADCLARLERGALPTGTLERHRAPAALAARVGAMLEGAARGAASTDRRGLWRRLGGLAASFLVGAVLAGAYATRIAQLGDEARVVEEAISEHVRVRMAGQAMQVASSDRHVVKPWFSGRLDLSPPLRDLAADGFPLQGARVDYLDRRPVAALVYRIRQHSIDLFVLPATPGAAQPPAAHAERGFNTLTWTADGFRFVAVSDVNAQDLARFQALLAR